MHKLFHITLITLVIFTNCSREQVNKDCSNAKPYTYWWWLGNAVDSADIVWNLENVKSTGIGGVHIVPIYGVKGEEENFIKYLSPDWVNMVKYTSEKAKELGIDVDMTLGSGWCFGGSWVDNRNGVMSAKIETIENYSGNTTVDLSSKSNYKVDTVLCVLAEFENGQRIDLSLSVSNGKLILPDTIPNATLYVFRMQGPKIKVKRAAPGAEGPMLNPLSSEAFEAYQEPFQLAFHSELGKYISCIYHDSYEYYGAGCSDRLFDWFEVKRGYKLQQFLPELVDKGNTEISRRVIADYRKSISELHMDYLKTVKKWADSNHTNFRNQAHGSPTNWLDAYAIADIPETESFGASVFNIPKFERDEKYISAGNIPQSDVFKFASSAAHVTGKKLVSSESHTWLREHFRVALSQCKPELDKLFVSGINHVYYHGTAYSPQDEKWPGWLFYASTNFALSNSQFCHFSALNEYVENCQSILQSSKSDNEIIVYYPFQDILHNFDIQKDILLTINVHNEEEWLAQSEFKKVLAELKKNGFEYDYISDLQLTDSKAEGKSIKTSGNKYKILIVPKCEYMPVETIQKLSGFAEKGVNIVFVDELPETFSGYSQTEQTPILFEKVKQSLKNAGLSNLRIINRDKLSSQLELMGAKKEELASFNLDFIRKIHGNGHVYFISNLNSGNYIDEYVSLGSTGGEYVFYDPMTGEKGRAKVKKNDKSSSVWIQLKQGQSLFLFAHENEENIKDWKYIKKEEHRFFISGNWTLDFLEGGPFLPESEVITQLTSWTTLPDSAASYFSGLARYSIDFNVNNLNENNKYVLHFDEVKESVHIRLNGDEVTTLFAYPFETDITDFLKEGRNYIELEVANLSANRIRFLDKQNVNWQKFYDINFVDINYKKFNASGWEPTDSGLIGDVTVEVNEIDKK